MVGHRSTRSDHDQRDYRCVDGMKTYAVFGEDGKVAPVYSISAGLDYPGVGPEHSYFNEIGRATYDSITDEEALEGFKLLSRLEGIILP